jgi:hypothetical protein
MRVGDGVAAGSVSPAHGRRNPSADTGDHRRASNAEFAGAAGGGGMLEWRGDVAHGGS